MLRSALTNNIFPITDSTYVAPSLDKTAKVEKSEGSKVASKQLTKLVKPILNRATAVFGMLQSLVANVLLNDSSVVELTSTTLLIFFVDGVRDLQLNAISVLCAVCFRFVDCGLLCCSSILAIASIV